MPTESTDNNVEIDANDIIRIMVSTDNHLGYGEKDAVRGKWSADVSDGEIATRCVFLHSLQVKIVFWHLRKCWNWPLGKMWILYF